MSIAYRIAASPTLVRADVADSAANGFTVKLAIAIEAPPQDVYSRLVHNVGDWWDPTHTFSGDAHNLSIDDKPMGCFCEKLPGGGGVRHLEVVYADPGKRLVLIGGLGAAAIHGRNRQMTIQLARGRRRNETDGNVCRDRLFPSRHERLGRAGGCGADATIHAAEKASLKMERPPRNRRRPPKA